MKIQEYNVIGSAVRLDEIPPEYRKLPLLGRGATTLAFALGTDQVILFTRDTMKREWLRDGLRMVHDEQIINPVKSHHIRGMSELPLFMIKMPRLYPLNSENRKKVTQEIRAFVEYTQNEKVKSPRDWPQGLVKMIDVYHQDHPQSQVLGLLEWLLNYDPDQFEWDLGPRQFKQTASGELVLLDPVVSSELMDLFKQKYLKQRY